MYSEQITKCRQEYDEQIQKLQSHIKELEGWKENHQGFIYFPSKYFPKILFLIEDELRKTMEVQKDVVCFLFYFI
jgi:hypothetical protein